MAPADVEGVAETIRYLRAVDKSLYAQATKTVKAAAAPAAESVKARIPSAPPLSGFAHKGRTGWNSRARGVSVSYRGTGRNATFWPLVSIRVTSAGGSLFDMAGRSSPNTLGRNLTGKHGSASRAAWPGVEAKKATVVAAVKAAADKVMRDTTNLLGRNVA